MFGNEFINDRAQLIGATYFIVILCRLLHIPNVEIPVFAAKFIDSPKSKKKVKMQKKTINNLSKMIVCVFKSRFHFYVYNVKLISFVDISAEHSICMNKALVSTMSLIFV